MHRRAGWGACLGPLIAAVGFHAAPALAQEYEHHEFVATLEAPYAPRAGDAREFTLRFDYPGAPDATTVVWRLELLAADGARVRSWRGELRLRDATAEVVLPWDGRGRARSRLSRGHYTARLSASPIDPARAVARRGTLAERVNAGLAQTPDQVQAWDIEVGKPRRPETRAFRAMPVGFPGEMAARSAPAADALPYTVYFGNLHSQTNDSDGGGAIPGCDHASNPQAGAFGPAAAFEFARNHGLDYLLVSEHNHLFDGSTQINAATDAAVARGRYAAGRAAASAFSAAHPAFLALYGMEWGVIRDAGHINIVNGDLLANWESNGSGQLIGDVATPKSDYRSLYAAMRQRGWIGQFNHPDKAEQFRIDGTVFAFDPVGDEVMVAAEVLNTKAFSSRLDEGETSISTFQSAFDLLLERGWHVAPTSNQDNHCANWGAAWTNRTGVLIPVGTTLSAAAFVEALRARRVFATADKNSQVVLLANGHLMGERFPNNGPLALEAKFANTQGRVVAQAQLFEGVPGRNGQVTRLANAATASIVPAQGAHFYYAKLTQDDGKSLWSAPVWVDPGAPAGAPTEHIRNGGFEAGTQFWTATADVITGSDNVPAHAGTRKAWLGGYGSVHTDTLRQTLALPAGTGPAMLSFQLRIDTGEAPTAAAIDVLRVQLRSSGNAILATLATFSNRDAGDFALRSLDVTAWRGRTLRVYFEGVEDAQRQTSFVVDDVSLVTH